MTQPNPVHPGRTYQSSRHVKDGAFRLTPLPEVVAIVRYLAFYHAKRHRLALLILVLMSNHNHIDFDDPLGVYPDFLRDFHSSVGKALNVLHFGREKGQFWDHEKPSTQQLLSLNATLEKLLYAAVNPVHAGIERHAQAWPGYIFGPERAGVVLHAKRPDVLPPSYPDVVEYRVPVPQDYGDRPANEVRAHFRRQLKKREKRERDLRGDKPFMGTKTALRLTHVAVPCYPMPEHQTELKPKFAGPPKLIAKAVAERREFRRKYRVCRRKQKRGETGIVWPAGTFAQTFRFGAPREPSPDCSFSALHHRAAPPPQ